MSNTAFSTSSTYRPTQPTVPTKIVVRSTSDSDDGFALSIYGDVSGVPSVDTSAGGRGRTETQTTSTFETLTQIISTDPAVGTITGLLPGTSAVGDIRGDVNPSNGDSILIGTVSQYLEYRFKNSLSTLGDVKIGATIHDTMFNLNAAINASGTPGVEYYGSIDANPIFSGSVATDVITLTDTVPCARQLDWEVSESASNFSIRLPIGGVDGPLMFTIPPGGTISAIPLSFSTEDISTETLPALMLAVSNYVSTNGSQSMYRIYSSQEITVKFQESTDVTNWHDSPEGEITITADTWTYGTLEHIADFLRFVIVTNANTTDTILDARVIY